jgi:anion-transporting  ArsA/GET3 family ATPase
MSARWLARTVIATVGTGGVGKTTTAAAIGIQGALSGRRTLVLTIDPARRLAQALGLESLGHQPQRVPQSHIGTAKPTGRGELFAMMLDTRRTFDEIVERFAPDAATRARILANPIYQTLTDALSGSREYSALEKLVEILDDGDYDLVVLDTPPAAHVLDFLDAPRRLMGFLDGSFLSVLLQPAGSLGMRGFRLLRLGSELGLRTLQRLTGFGFLGELTEFFHAFEGLLAGFRARAEHVNTVLRGPSCGFILVAGPDAEQVARASSFHQSLQRERVQLIGLVVNRVQHWPSGPIPDTSPEARQSARQWLEPATGAQAASALVDVASRHAERARRDAEAAERLEKILALHPTDVHRVPLLVEDIHTARGLHRLRGHLFPE